MSLRHCHHVRSDNVKYINNVTGTGKMQNFSDSMKFDIFAMFDIYNVWVTSWLSMSIYNCTISELQPLILQILRVIKFLMCILTIDWNVGFFRICHIYMYNIVMCMYWILNVHNNNNYVTVLIPQSQCGTCMYWKLTVRVHNTCNCHNIQCMLQFNVHCTCTYMYTIFSTVTVYIHVHVCWMLNMYIVQVHNTYMYMYNMYMYVQVYTHTYMCICNTYMYMYIYNMQLSQCIIHHNVLYTYMYMYIHTEC